MKIDIIKIAKKTFKDKELIIENVGKSKVRINYLAEMGNYNRKPFVLPKYIKIDEEFIEWSALYLGDGDFNRKDKNHTTFGSKDADIIKFYNDFIRDRFYILNKDLTIMVAYRKRNQCIRREWSKVLRFPESRILTKFSKRHKEESCNIQINGVVFRKIFEVVIRKVIDSKFLSKKSFRTAFLRGIFAAEGGLGIQYLEGKPYIDCVSFSISTEECQLRELICSALDIEGIRWSTYIDEKRHSFTIKITNWQNYLKLWDICIFDLCQRKKDKFVNIARDLDIYLRLNSKFREKFFYSLNMYQKEIAKLINSWQANVCRTIKGIHLLRVEQILSLLSYSNFNMDDILRNTEEIRIGSLTRFAPSKKIKYFIKEFKLI